MRTAPGMLALLASLVLVSTAAPAIAQQTPRIVVEGTAEVSVPPDRATLTFSIETRAADAQSAAQRNAQRQASAIAALREAGVGEDRLSTIGYGVQPDWRWSNGERRLAGHIARTSLRVRSDDLSELGRLIDAALGAGVNEVGSVELEASTLEHARRQALAQAVRNARAAAEAMAAAAGGTLGTLIELSTRLEGRPPAPVARAMAMEAAPDTQIIPGEQTVSVTVIGRWSFLQDS